MKLDPPVKSISDDIHALTKGTISCIPAAGGLLAEFFSLVVTPSLDRRRQEWMTQVAQGLTELRNRVDAFSWETLREDEHFIDVLLHASQIALRNHQAEKLVALQNAVCNTALKIDIEEVHQTLFLRYVDELTVLHLKLLHLLNNPREWEEKNGQKFPSRMSGIRQMIYDAIPELTGRNDLSKLLVKDLQSRGIIEDFSLGITTIPREVIMSAHGTDMGNRFIRYISEPSI